MKPIILYANIKMIKMCLLRQTWQPILTWWLRNHYFFIRTLFMNLVSTFYFCSAHTIIIFACWNLDKKKDSPVTPAIVPLLSYTHSSVRSRKALFHIWWLANTWCKMWGGIYFFSPNECQTLLIELKAKLLWYRSALADAITVVFYIEASIPFIKWGRVQDMLSWLWSCQITKYNKISTGSPLPSWCQLEHENVSFVNSPRNVVAWADLRMWKCPEAWQMSPPSYFHPSSLALCPSQNCL